MFPYFYWTRYGRLQSGLSYGLPYPVNNYWSYWAMAAHLFGLSIGRLSIISDPFIGSEKYRLLMVASLAEQHIMLAVYYRHGHFTAIEVTMYLCFKEDNNTG